VTEGLKKCCVPTAVGGTGDDMWNGSERDGVVRSECEEDESFDYEGGKNDTD
jgi:hypothetical protein